MILAPACGNIMVMKSVWEARKKILGVAAVLVLVLMLVSFNNRLGEYFRLSNERDKLSAEVEELQGTQVALETQVAYATSDQAVEDWARNEARMAKPGDKVVILLTPHHIATEIFTQPTPTPRTVENWEIWWALFFEE